MYINSRLSWAKRYERNKQGRVTKWVQYDSLRKLEYTASYIYEEDGSYKINITDEEYKLRLHSAVFNKAGKIQSEFLMDGGRHNYKYDSLDRLVKMDSQSGLDGYDQYRAEFNYDQKGKLVVLKLDIYPFHYETVEKYYYDAQGLLIRSEQTVNYKDGGLRNFYVNKYTYIFRNKN